MIVWYLWAKGGATHQQVGAILHGHLHAIHEMAPWRVGCHQVVLTQRLLALFLQQLARNAQATRNPMGCLQQTLGKCVVALSIPHGHVAR